ncbi:MAG: hypothetical protein ACR2IE_09875 [Candidatus Sumerlaeaceae bacterium]
MAPPYDPSRVEDAVRKFNEAGLTPAEALLAAARVLQESLKAFQQHAPRFRAEIGEPATHDFARQEFNDLIYELQDTIPSAIRTYNSLLRDPDQKHDPIPGE